MKNILRHKEDTDNAEQVTSGMKQNFISNLLENQTIISVPVWLSGRTLRQLSERLWVRFPGNTCTNKNV